MAAVHVLTLAALAVVASGQTYFMFSIFSDATCTSPDPSETPRVMDIGLLQDPGLAEMQAFLNGCVLQDGNYIHVRGCEMGIYSDSACTVQIMEMIIPGMGMCEDDGDGRYRQTTCVDSVPSGAIDNTCLTSMPMSMPGLPSCASSCNMDSSPPESCSAAQVFFESCATACESEADMNLLNLILHMFLGCSCNVGHANANATAQYTCGEIRAAYKDGHCCGNPNSPFELPGKEAHRRLAGGSRPGSSFQLGRPVRWGSFPRKLSIPTLTPTLPASEEAVALRAITRKLKDVQLQRGAPNFRKFAVEVSAILDTYLAKEL